MLHAPRIAKHSAALAALLLTLLAASLVSAQSLDIGGWTLHQEASTQSFTIPAGTYIPAGGYVVVARDVDQAAFESYYGVSLGSNVVFIRSSNSVPMINGDETYELRNSSGVNQDGPTPAIGATRQAYHRIDPETLAWTTINDTPTPGAGVELPDAVMSGVVISEVNDPDSYTYEYLELYYDGTTGSSNQPPLISGLDLSPAAPSVGDDITVTAQITDSDGTISQAQLWLRYDGGTFGSVAMSNSGGSTYTASLYSVPGDVELQYYVSATDNDATTATDPAGAPSTWHAVTIAGLGGGPMTILFDHAHDQDAGSAGNWRVDDNHPTPYPAAPTSETSWNGQLSTWGYELYLLGHTVISNTSAITGSQLADVDLLVIPEPQNPFTASEIEAVRQFVLAGGSLFMVADHNSSDRNNNGWDSPSIFGGYTYPHITDPVGSDTETFAGALFGLHFHVKDEGNNSISGSYTNVNSDPANPVIHGSYGDVSGVYYHVGNVMTLWPTANANLSDVGSLIAKDDGYPHIAAWSRYGSGKVVGYGDSSSMADGTGSESHENNWTEANHREFFLNACEWLLDQRTSAVGDIAPRNPGLNLRAAPNPFNPITTISFEMPQAGRARVDVFDPRGRMLRSLLDEQRSQGVNRVEWNGRDENGRTLPSGVYLVRALGAGHTSYTRVLLAK
jgi:flagellar hook capping protein FlgD